MNAVTKIRLTTHAAQMMLRREIELTWIEDTIRNPSVQRADERDSSLKLSLRQIEQAGGKWLRVVYRMDNLTHLVVTAFFDRNQEKRK